MLLKDISLPTPQENILFDEVLLHLAEENSSEEVLRFWESDIFFIVLGRISKEKEDVHFSTVQLDHIPVLRRSSGGGTVLQGPGCLNFSLILSKERNPGLNDVRKSYEHILGQVIHALKQLGVEAVFLPTSDVALKNGQKKISGNAQRRLRKYILHHGTILYDFDLQKIKRYLNIPRDMPVYRQGRSHLDFVANIHLPVERIKAQLIEEFSANERHDGLSKEEERRLAELLDSKKVLVV